MITFKVNLSEKSYPIYISKYGWDDLCETIVSDYNSQSVLIVSDSNIYPIYFEHLSRIFEAIGVKVFSAVIPAGENSKSLPFYDKLVTQALQNGLNRKSAIIALGGGVTGDLAGFAAATYMRGIDLIQIPTSLLAQVDSSVGGKVAVNHPLAKNIIGAFYQPAFVYINVLTLSTLPKREFSSGLAEIIKHGFIYDVDFLKSLAENIDKLMQLDIDFLAEAIETSCRIKAAIVEQDEKENGIRAILNFGHTIGHAIEAVAGYDTYTHGEAISMGMVYESLIAKELGLISSEYVEYLRHLLSQANLPTVFEGLDAASLVQKMAFDKKNQSKGITFVLPTNYGKVEIFRDINKEIIEKVLM